MFSLSLFKRIFFVTSYSCFLFLQACTQQQEQKNSSSSEIDVSIGKEIKIKSSILKEECSIYVSVPDDYEKSSQKYPVIYVLDGKYHFPIVYAAAHLLYDYLKIPECIVVGIGTNNRNRDYTPPLTNHFSKPAEMSAAGGANTYLDYIEKELIPFIDKNYRTQPNRTIIGHSLGGLLAVHAFTTRPSLFQSTINIDGSLWFNDGASGDALINYLNNHPDQKGNFIWVKEKMDTMYWFPITHKLNNYFVHHKLTSLYYKFIEIENEQHETLIYPGVYLGLRAIFENYNFTFSPTTTFADIKRHYDSLSNAVNYKVPVPEDIYAMNREHCIIIWKDMDMAIATCEEWMKAYPSSSKAYEMAGRTYLQTGKKDLAIKYFKKSLELKPDNKNLIETLKKTEGN